MSPFIKAKFKGVFKKTNSQYIGNFVHSDFDWKYIEITSCERLDDFDIEAFKTNDYRFYKKISPHKYWKIGKKTEIIITSGENQFYSGSIYNVLLKNLKLAKDETSLLGSDWREVNGDIYFQIDPKNKVSDAINANSNNVSGLNILADSNSIVATKNGNDVSGLNIFSLSDADDQNQNSFTDTRASRNISSVQSIPVSQNIGRWSKWILRILFGLLFLLLLLYFWNAGRLLFYVLAVIGVLWLISRIINLGRIVRFIGSLLLFGFIGYFLFKLFYDTSSSSTSVKKKEGNIKITPPKETDTNGDGKIDDEITGKEINWYDFLNAFYKAKYNTSITEFKNSTSKQNELKNRIVGYQSSVEFYSQFYSGLNDIDKDKITAIAKIFSDSAMKKKLSVSQTAEMVVTFIQEIPYYLVHEGNCNEAMQSGNSFMIDYHRQKKPCLPNIIAGVQSPYEFLHNLKGDCDTRSLLAFSILKKLNIAVSVWISEVYGHSILGVGVPVGHGLHKEIDGINHYGVELTAKGFRLGMVAPEQNYPNNWDIAIYSNP